MEKSSNIGMVHRECALQRKAAFQALPTPQYKIGDFVKKGFDIGDGQFEWMWVKVCDVFPAFLLGVLDNYPLDDRAGVKFGELVTVQLDEICQYASGDDE